MLQRSSLTSKEKKGEHSQNKNTFSIFDRTCQQHRMAHGIMGIPSTPLYSSREI